jgi:hypothetical protein
MALSFPNQTRNFDEMRKAVRFVGHDGLFEIQFFVEVRAFSCSAASEHDALEANCLSAFDRSRASIQEVARAAYSNKRLNSYTLSAADFR